MSAMRLERIDRFLKFIHDEVEELKKAAAVEHPPHSEPKLEPVLELCRRHEANQWTVRKRCRKGQLGQKIGQIWFCTEAEFLERLADDE